MDPQQGFHWPRVPAWPLNTVLGSSPLTSYKRMPFATPETEDPPLVDDPCWLSKIRKFLVPYSIWLMVSWCFMCVSILPNQVLHITFSSLAISRSPWRSSSPPRSCSRTSVLFFGRRFLTPWMLSQHQRALFFCQIWSMKMMFLWTTNFYYEKDQSLFCKWRPGTLRLQWGYGTMVIWWWCFLGILVFTIPPPLPGWKTTFL